MVAYSSSTNALVLSINSLTSSRPLWYVSSMLAIRLEYSSVAVSCRLAISDLKSSRLVMSSSDFVYVLR
ncbi:hypothetical protein [Vulcanisaeta thermophila]|uniref:hypothetical protein n=1 Tax=Vulcanisaeta thermophila TaxID=867917 RepID=UPI000852E0D5|nr:hypothetical protein [Vulcanisaeta thermophila]